jgi:hypothetical protein
MGWLGLMFGLFTSDFWVAGHILLSSYATTLSSWIILVIVLIHIPEGVETPYQVWNGEDYRCFVCAECFDAFGVVLALAVLFGLSIWELSTEFSKYKTSNTFNRDYGSFWGVPVYSDLWVINQDPLLSIWNSQTRPSPPLVDLLFSLSPILILAFFGIPGVFQTKEAGLRLLLVWSLVGLLLLYLPWELQRRFMIGIFIPLCSLAASGLYKIAKSTRTFTFLTTLLVD